MGREEARGSATCSGMFKLTVIASERIELIYRTASDDDPFAEIFNNSKRVIDKSKYSKMSPAQSSGNSTNG